MIAAPDDVWSIGAAGWAAFATFASAIAAAAAAYAAWKVGRGQVELTGYSILREELDRFDSPRLREYRRTLCAAHQANQPLDRDLLNTVLGQMELIAGAVKRRNLRLEHVFDSELGWLVRLYVCIGADHIRQQQVGDPLDLILVTWLDQRLRRHEWIRRGATRRQRIARRFTAPPALSKYQRDEWVDNDADLWPHEPVVPPTVTEPKR